MSNSDTTEETRTHPAASGEINSNSHDASDETINHKVSRAKNLAIELASYFALATFAVALAITVATTMGIKLILEKYQDKADKSENEMCRQTANSADTVRADPSQVKR